MDTLVEADRGMHAAPLVPGTLSAFGGDEAPAEDSPMVIRQAIARAQRRIAYLDHLIRFTQQQSKQRRDGAVPGPVADHAQMLAATLVAFRHAWLHHLQDLERPEFSTRGRGSLPSGQVAGQGQVGPATAAGRLA